MANTKIKDSLNAISTPILFQTLRDYNILDSRFTKVKIWLMHLGENLNGSVFTEEVVKRAIPSLANTPIMGFFNPKSNDFEGHEIELQEDEENGFTMKHMTVPYGVIPQDNKAQFEDRVGDDGITRTYLTVEGLLWNKWEEAINVLSSKSGLTGQSMEITDFSYEFDEKGYAVFNDFKFDGACMLGDSTPPAMNSSTVEIAFSKEVGQNIINEKLETFYKSFEEGGTNLDKEELQLNEETKVEDTQEEEAQAGFEEAEADSNKSEDAPKEEEKSTSKKKTTKSEPKEEPKEESKPSEEKPKEEPKEDSEEHKEEEKDIETISVEGSPIEVVKEDTLNDAKVQAKEDDALAQPAETRITVGDNVYSVEEAKEVMEKYFTLVQELHEKEIDDLFATHAEDLTDDEVASLKANAYAKTKAEVETEIYAVIGRKAFSSKKESPKKSVFSSVKTESKEAVNDYYGGILNKHKK